ncbi:MAG: 3-deoxy-8-phosphooctulonate synthase [Caedimonadaceae bacterium]|nr:MAG: 3-deoxy-8-phosphooctulonate synthase [Caedimonadaceae bacterium]
MQNRIVTIGSAPAKPLQMANHLPLTIIAGPCMLESRDHAMEMATALKELSLKVGMPLIFKTSFDKANRTSSASPRGAGLEKALEVFSEVREKIGLPVVTDVHTAEQCELVAKFVDLLQIPAFLCRQTDLLMAAAATGKPVHVKKGQFLAPWDMKNVVKKFDDAKNTQVMLCERGASFGYNTLVSDMRALPILKETGCPVVFDATHSVQQPGGAGEKSGGERRFVSVLAKAAVTTGIAGVFLETHENPDQAPSDGPNMVKLKDMENLLMILKQFDELAKSELALAANS